MKKRFVTVHLNNSRFKMELIQFIIDTDGTVLAICMDEEGHFDTYSMSVIQGEKFE